MPPAAAVVGPIVRSGLQREVLSLYRHLLRATAGQSQLRAHVRQEFANHAQLRRTEVERIEYLVGRGRKQLAVLAMKGVRKVAFVNVK